MAIVLPMQNPL